ncbi:MAG: carboxyltransferase domain-containing protein, partial [Actinobacteria bacterium]|nr:carboxyltransferase domain-containing protein [Actinomycetota bacterium]
MEVRPAGDAALLLAATPTDQNELGSNRAASVAAAVRSAALPGVIDVVPAAETVLVTVEPGSWDLTVLATQLRSLAAVPVPALAADSTAELVLDTVYDGPDLANVATISGLTVAEVISRHAAASYRVGWLGFSPGFGYLTGLDPVLAAVPRLATPRVTVPAGSVAIAGGLAAVYPSASPGGWQLLGRTAELLWDPLRDPPTALSPGRRVRFRPVEQLAPLPAATRASPYVPSGQRWIQVLQPGPLTTVQDLGRTGLAHLGVPGSGAADAAS